MKLKIMTLISILVAFGFVSCTSVNPIKQIVPAPQEVKLTISGVENVKVSPDSIVKSMELKNEDLELSRFCFIHGDTAYLQISYVSSYTTDSLWTDFQILGQRDIKRVIVYMNNPGGSSFDGAGIYDQLRILRSKGVHITTEGYGIIASAAVPIFLMADKRIASENLIFLIHPASLFKWGFFTETLRDLKSQTKMMEMCKTRYSEAVSKNSKLSAEDVMKMMEEDTWFGVTEALEWGMVDEIR